jgi:hypothetical protein
MITGISNPESYLSKTFISCFITILLVFVETEQDRCLLFAVPPEKLKSPLLVLSEGKGAVASPTT